MNILFLSLGRIWDIEEHGIYSDLIREFARHGDHLYVVTPLERRYRKETELLVQGNVKILKVRTLNLQKTNKIEKGLGTFSLENLYFAVVKKYFSDVKFDLILYPTPPITLVRPIKYIKKRDGAASYLMLKDIFPQNAVDIGMMAKKTQLYRYFRRKERELYAISDTIGCMSQANVDYLLAHNPKIGAEKVEIFPNSVEYCDRTVSAEERNEMRRSYHLPLDRKIFVYGGNLGKPQGIPFLMDCLKAMKEDPDVFFLIVGDGTEYRKLEAFFREESPKNMLLMKQIPKEDYDKLVAACDVGMIFLDHRFTIPNFPSRLLGYMQAGLPVLACTDPNTDIGRLLTEEGLGWWCESNDVGAFTALVKTVLSADLQGMASAEKRYLQEHFSVEKGYEIIKKHL